MERREINRQMIHKKIDRVELGLWSMSISCLLLMAGSLSLAMEARNLRNEEVVWNTNIASEEMNHYLKEEKERRLFVARENDKGAFHLMTFALLMQFVQIHTDNQRRQNENNSH